MSCILKRLIGAFVDVIVCILMKAFAEVFFSRVESVTPRRCPSKVASDASIGDTLHADELDNTAAIEKKANLVGDVNPKTSAFGEERHDDIVTQKPKLGSNELKAEPAPKPVLRSSMSKPNPSRATENPMPLAGRGRNKRVQSHGADVPRSGNKHRDWNVKCVEQDGRRLAGLVDKTFLTCRYLSAPSRTLSAHYSLNHNNGFSHSQLSTYKSVAEDFVTEQLVLVRGRGFHGESGGFLGFLVAISVKQKQEPLRVAGGRRKSRRLRSRRIRKRRPRRRSHQPLGGRTARQRLGHSFCLGTTVAHISVMLFCSGAVVVTISATLICPDVTPSRFQRPLATLMVVVETQPPRLDVLPGQLDTEITRPTSMVGVETQPAPTARLGYTETVKAAAICS
ncbi:hypothetical protein BC938DRAFT_482214 [Jimgerdemannia flammicorona]|uniref:Uncharacterized protein n=1 Tax=Jimgerdemannia flammicorona TaxID=994334 RepID=A0A433QEC3_9FUNG|nr:hypothetical protein BC938DRAFT_482214 [Jimgerdemannia flammicorona]